MRSLAAAVALWTLGLLGGVCAWANQADPGAATPSSEQGDLPKTHERVWDFLRWRVVTLANGQVQLWDLRDPTRPLLRDAWQVDGAVRHVSMENGELRMTVVRTQELRWRMEPTGELLALPSAATPQACPALVSHTPPKGSRRYLGVVEGVEAGEAVIALSEGADAWLDQSVALVASFDPNVDAGLARQVLAINRLEGRKAYAELPRGETATAGDLVVATGHSPEIHRWQPAKLDYERWWSAGIAPVLPTTTTVGAAIFGSAGARLYGPWEGELRVAPLYFLADGSLGPGLITAAVRFDRDYWALGAGVGGLHAVSLRCNWGIGSPSAPGEVVPPASDCTGWQPALSAEGRLGSKDGLHLGMRAVYSNQRPEWGLVIMEGLFSVPLSRAADVGMEFSAGSEVEISGLFGRYALIGNRGPGSTILQIGIARAQVEANGVDLRGPQLSFSLAYRY